MFSSPTANAQEHAIAIQFHPEQLNWKKPEHTKNMFYFLLQFKKYELRKFPITPNLTSLNPTPLIMLL